MITDTRKIRAYFAPLISETTFAGILATVNGQKLISLFNVGRVSVFYCSTQNQHYFIWNMLPS